MASTGVHLFRGIDNDWTHVGQDDADDNTDEHPHDKRITLQLVKWTLRHEKPRPTKKGATPPESTSVSRSTTPVSS